MLKRLIRWLARAEIGALRAELELSKMDEAAGMRLLAQARINADAAVGAAYANGMMAGRVIGQAEMLSHLRGDVSEPATTEIIARRAAGMVH